MVHWGAESAPGQSRVDYRRPASAGVCTCSWSRLILAGKRSFRICTNSADLIGKDKFTTRDFSLRHIYYNTFPSLDCCVPTCVPNTDRRFPTTPSTGYAKTGETDKCSHNMNQRPCGHYQTILAGIPRGPSSDLLPRLVWSGPVYGLVWVWVWSRSGQDLVCV